MILFVIPVQAGSDSCHGAVIAYDFGANVDNRPTNQTVVTQFNSVDFDSNGLGDFWNQMGWAPPGMYSGVRDIGGGLVSGAWFALEEVMNFNPNDTSAPTPSQWKNALGVPNEVLPTLYYDSPFTPLMFFTFGGLQPGSRWNVEVFSVLNNDNILDLSLNGQTIVGHNRQTYFSTLNPLDAKVDFQNVAVDANGKLRLDVIGTHGNYFPVIQVVRMTSVPEPTSFVLCGMGALGLVVRRFLRRESPVTGI